MLWRLLHGGFLTGAETTAQPVIAQMVAETWPGERENVGPRTAPGKANSSSSLPKHTMAVSIFPGRLSPSEQLHRPAHKRLLQHDSQAQQCVPR